MAEAAEAVYFDANTLVYWALGNRGSAKDTEQRCAVAVTELIKGDDSLACSPLTLSEFTGTLWSMARSGSPDLKYFGEPEAAAALEELMGLLASGRLRVRNLHPRAFEVGMGLVASGAREKGRSFRAPDAIHLFEAAQWSRTIDRNVVVVSSDSDLERLVETFPEFGRYVEIRDLTS